MGDRLARGEHDHAVGDEADEPQVVLDQQHRDAARADAPDDLGQAVELVRARAGRQLIDEQHVGLTRERRGQRDEPPLGAGELRDGSVGLAFQADDGEGFERGALCLALLSARAGRRQRGPDRARVAAPDAAADEDALERGQLGEPGGRLQRAPEPDLDAVVGGSGADVAAADQYAAGVGRLRAREQAEGRRLAGPVRADERRNLSAFELEVEAVERHDSAERLAQGFRAQHLPLRRRARRARGRGVRPVAA